MSDDDFMMESNTYSETERLVSGNTRQNPHGQVRNLIGFGLLGLCNNFGYVIMLSAAHDVLGHHGNETNSSSEAPQNRSGKLISDCNRIGTGAILLADILPAVIIKITAPWYIQKIPYSVRVLFCSALSLASFPIVALPEIVWINLIGVACASLSSGLGEITFLALTSQYHRNCVSTWSSGTGAAGLFGALSYAGLTAVGVSSQTAILIMVVIPVVMAISYFFVLSGSEVPVDTAINYEEEQDDLLSQDSNTSEEPEVSKPPLTSLGFKERIRLVKPLLKYMIPLGLVYFAEYFINQALYELMYFEKSWPPKKEQYRWYQTIYQLGVFCSRSSVNLIKIRKIWILTILQFLVLMFLLLQVFLSFLPSVWLVFVVILFEGLLGGAAYVNTFDRITVEVKELDRREFSMGVASVSDSVGITIAGAVSLPVHNYICTL